MSDEEIQEKNTNSLLKKIQLPGQTFRLPSRGLFYQNGEIDDRVQDGEVEVFPLTTIDEINMKSPDQLFQGTAIEKVFVRAIPAILKPTELLTRDIDYLLACLRVVSYGRSLPLEITCNGIEIPKSSEETPEETPEEIVEEIVEEKKVDLSSLSKSARRRYLRTGIL